MRQQPARTFLTAPGQFRHFGYGAPKLTPRHRDYRAAAKELLLLLGTVETADRRAGTDTARIEPYDVESGAHLCRVGKPCRAPNMIDTGRAGTPRIREQRTDPPG